MVNIKFIGCSEDDAISCKNAMFKPGTLKLNIYRLFDTYKLGQELTKLSNNDNYEQLFNGIPCEILKLRSEGWQKGTVRINLEVSIEFCPDEPEIEVIPEIKEPESPLDDLRRMINDTTS